jgi:hypothetical protein
MKGHSMKTNSKRDWMLSCTRSLVLLCAPLAAAACFQPVDESATSGTIEQINKPEVPDFPVTTTFTPDIPAGTLSDGTTTPTDQGASGCSVTNAQAMDVLTSSCAGCHTPDSDLSGVTGFDILDWTATKTTLASGQSYVGKTIRYLKPGAPEKSLIYVRIANHTMPKPPGSAADVQVRFPTASDVSLLNGWIKFCVGNDPMPEIGSAP